MKLFFKDEFKKEGKYLISFDHLKWYKRNIFKKIRDNCGSFVCPSDNRAMGTNLLSMLICCETRFLRSRRKKSLLQIFFFENIVYKNNKMHSWDAQPSDPKCLKHLSYSR